jgi:hypothetical protein
MARCRADLAAIALAFVLATPAAALADPRPMVEEARREFERGQEQFADRDYDGALASYEVGFAIDPHPDFLYARGQALRLSGDCGGAVEAYHGFSPARRPRPRPRSRGSTSHAASAASPPRAAAAR